MRRRSLLRRRALPGMQEMLGEPTAFALFREAGELWEALLARLPEELRAAVMSIKEIRSDDEFDEKYELAVDRIIEFARESDDVGEGPDRRVLCPLCNAGAMSAYEEGFKYPDGLWKHLVGDQRSHVDELFHPIRLVSSGYS